jgi:ribosome-associated translation inhibitor RaiA
MQTPVQVTFRGLPVSDTLEEMCRLEAEKLERYDPRIISCRITVARPGRHHKGDAYDIRIDLRRPGRELIVSREATQHPASENPRLAVREAFDTARRQLEEHVRRRRVAG